MTENNNSTINKPLLDEQRENLPVHTSGNPIIGWVVRLFKGLLAGIGAITPGLSGGVLLVVSGSTNPGALAGGHSQ